VDIVAVVACHDGTIGIRFTPCKSVQAPVVPWRNNTCSSVETAEPDMPHIAGAIVESKRKNASGAIPRTFRSAISAPLHTAKTNVQTSTYAQRAGGSQIRFILPSLNRPDSGAPRCSHVGCVAPFHSDQRPATQSKHRPIGGTEPFHAESGD
jgi:hypothetical protein